VWEEAFDGLLVLDVGSGACGITGTLSLRAGDAAPERPTTGSDAPD
jgi:hypothetical protein